MSNHAFFVEDQTFDLKAIRVKGAYLKLNGESVWSKDTPIRTMEIVFSDPIPVPSIEIPKGTRLVQS